MNQVKWRVLELVQEVTDSKTWFNMSSSVNQKSYSWLYGQILWRLRIPVTVQVFQEIWGIIKRRIQ